MIHRAYRKYTGALWGVKACRNRIVELFSAALSLEIRQSPGVGKICRMGGHSLELFSAVFPLFRAILH